MTVGQWSTTWLEAQVQLKPLTRERYRNLLKVQVLARWQRVRLAEVTHADVVAWVAGLQPGYAAATTRQAQHVFAAPQVVGKGPVTSFSPRGAPLRNHNFRARVFDPAAAAIGVPLLTPHDLRHTAAGLAIQAGANVKAVQRMLGDASAAMTLDVYAGPFGDDLGDVAERLDGAVARARADSLRTRQPGQEVLPYEPWEPHAG